MAKGALSLAKICKSCGKEYSGEWCEHCGYGNPDLKVKAAEKYKKIQKPVRHMTEEEKARYYAEQTKKTKSKRKSADSKALKILTAAFCVLLVAAIVLFVLYKKEYIFKPEDKSEVISNYFQSINDRDFDAFLSCVPDEIEDQYKSEAEKMDIESGNEIEFLYSDFSDIYGDDFKFDITIGRESEVDSSTISDYEDQYKELYDSSINISEASSFAVEAKISGEKSESTVYYEVYVAKIGGHRYIVDAAVVTPSVNTQTTTIGE